MKELSIEEKAKRYDEALTLMQDCIPDEDGLVHVRPEEIFPELKESEDERVWRELIEGFKRYDDGALFNGCLVRDIVAWLEKQGEQPKKHDVCNNCDQQGSCVSPCPMKLVEKQGEQKLAEWTAEDEEELKIALNTLEEAGQYSSAKWLKNVCLVPQTMQKPTAWSEDDQSNFNELSSFIFEYRTEDASRLITWFKSLKYRVQPKQEWSEEDESILNEILKDIMVLKYRDTGEVGKAAYQKEIEWLKTKFKYLRPQSHWKPSKEQITVLHDVAAYIDNSIYPNQKDILVNLYLQLKKLMEE